MRTLAARVGSAPAALLAMVLVLPTTGAQVDQQTIAKQLLGQDVKQRNEAFERAQLLRPANMTADLRAALITLLERENDLVGQAYKHGKVVANLEDPEFIAKVSRVVAELRDPSAIPALSVAIYGGLTVMRALADFGEPAAPAVLSVVTSPDSMREAVNDGLIALRFMVEGANEHPLAPATLAEIRRAARQRLATGKGVYFTTLWRAIDLAVAVDDPELRAVVMSLASDRGELIARGVTDPELIEKTQKLASDRLVGIPPLPRRQPG